MKTLYYAIVKETGEHVIVFERLKFGEVKTDLGIFGACDLRKISPSKWMELEDQADLVEFSDEQR